MTRLMYTILALLLNVDARPFIVSILYYRNATYSFRCNDGTCINDLLVCDGKNDCPLGDDEVQCYEGTSDAMTTELQNNDVTEKFVMKETPTTWEEVNDPENDVTRITTPTSDVNKMTSQIFVILLGILAKILFSLTHF